MSLGYDVALVGATGAVGEVFLEVLEDKKFPIGQFYPLASERSAGQTITFNDQDYVVGNTADFDFSKVQFAFFSAGSSVSAMYVPKAADAGAVVIDNTSQFRYEHDIPLVVPEINAEALRDFRKRNIIANPNCSTIQLVLVLKPIYDAVGITRVNVSTYQAVSGAGRTAIEELARQTADMLNGQEPILENFTKQIAFNVIPQIDMFLDNGYTKEEMKMVWETQKILADNTIKVNATAVRVPVFYGHSEAVNVETTKDFDLEELRILIAKAPGVEVIADERDYPTAVCSAAGQDDVYVGRIRRDISTPHGLNLWVVGDNVRKGAALNAVQIATTLIENDFYRE